jgi:hypothetical protein
MMMIIYSKCNSIKCLESKIINVGACDRDTLKQNLQEEWQQKKLHGILWNRKTYSREIKEQQVP